MRGTAAVHPPVFRLPANARLAHTQPFAAQVLSHQLAMDIFGLVEQLICANAMFWVAVQSWSTFSVSIYQKRIADMALEFPERPLTDTLMHQLGEAGAVGVGDAD